MRIPRVEATRHADLQMVDSWNGPIGQTTLKSLDCNKDQQHWPWNHTKLVLEAEEFGLFGGGVCLFVLQEL